jgi:hypothetical protein
VIAFVQFPSRIVEGCGLGTARSYLQAADGQQFGEIVTNYSKSGKIGWSEKSVISIT